MSFDTDKNGQERLALARDVADHHAYAYRVSEDYFRLGKRIGFYKSYFIVAVCVVGLSLILLVADAPWMWVSLLVLAAVNLIGNAFLGQKSGDCWARGGVWGGLAYQLSLRMEEGETEEGDQGSLEEARSRLHAVSEHMEALRWEARRDRIVPEVRVLYPYPAIGGGQKSGWKRDRIRKDSREYMYALVLVALLFLGAVVVVATGGGGEHPATSLVASRVADRLQAWSQAIKPESAAGGTPGVELLEAPRARTLNEIVAAWMEASDGWGGDLGGWMRSEGLAGDVQDQMEGAVGLFKSSALLPELHQVAVLHGWGDDLSVCDEIVRFLHQKEPGRYACAFLADLEVRDGTISMRTP